MSLPEQTRAQRAAQRALWALYGLLAAAGIFSLLLYPAAILVGQFTSDLGLWIALSIALDLAITAFAMSRLVRDASRGQA